MSGIVIDSFRDADLTRADLMLFSGGCWLNSSCINYAYRRIEEELENELRQSSEDAEMNAKRLSTLQSILMMDPSVVSFLVLQCTEDDEFEEFYNGIEVYNRSWILLPVNNNESFESNESASHWSLLACHVSSGTLLHFDSSRLANNEAAKRVAKNLYRLLKRKDAPKVINVASAPQQTNGYDCGIYVILASKRIAQLILSATLHVPSVAATPSQMTTTDCTLVENNGELLARGVREWLTVDKVRQFRIDIVNLVEEKAKEREREKRKS